MTQWWDQLGSLSKFFYLFAVPSTVILLLQSVLTLIGGGMGSDDMDFGGGGTGADMDFDSDFNMDVEGVDDFDALAGATDFKFITLRGIIAFATMFGWIGAALADTSLHITVIMVLAIMAGLAGMFIIAFLFYSISKLQQSGNMNYRNAIGKDAKVYIPIPPQKRGQGKVQLLLQDSFIEVNAVTEDTAMIGTNEMVQVVDMLDATTLVVERLK